MNDDQLVAQTMRYTSHALFLSSWHVNDGESAAMWDLFSHGTEPGVAIESTVGLLREQIDAGSGDTEVFLGAVEYLDYARTWGAFRAFNRVFHKRRSFEHERELRAVIVRPRYAELAALDLERVIAARYGIDVPIAFGRLAPPPGCRRGPRSGSPRSWNASWARSKRTCRSRARGCTTRLRIEARGGRRNRGHSGGSE